MAHRRVEAKREPLGAKGCLRKASSTPNLGMKSILPITMLRSSLASALVLFLSASALSAQMFTFKLDEEVMVANLADAKVKPRSLGKGYDPAISPDGTKVAYTQTDEQGDRRIAIFDVTTGKSSLVKGIPGKNEFMPVWSTDGTRLLFSHFKESDWALASVNAGGGGFQIVIDQGVRQTSGYSPLPNATDWLCHDLEQFFLATVPGTGAAVIKDLPKPSLIEGLSMPSRIAVSPDGKTALFDQMMGGEGGPDADEPPSAVFLIEIATGKLTRLTPKGLFADSPTWLPGGREFLFGSFNSKTEKPTIHRMAAEPGAKPVQVIANGSNPSAASK